MVDIFEDFDPADTLARLTDLWNFAAPLPIPMSAFDCPVCLGARPILRQWRFHEKIDSPSRFRCDVSFKCRWCAAVWIHGLVVPAGLYHRHAKQTYNRRDARRLFKQEGWAP